jgi:hypothetical protein
VRAAAVGGAVTVSWQPGDAGTSPITSYQVTVSPGGSVVTVGGTSLSATIDGLSTTTAYTFTVTAVNSVGAGAPSAPTPPVTPSIPTVLAAQVKPSVTFGSSLALQATLLRADTHAALPGKQVLIFRRRSASAPWAQVRNLSTNSKGLADALLHPKRSAQLEAVFPGASGEQRSEAFEKYVVRPTVGAALSATTVKHGRTVTITGSAAPFVAHQQVQREHLVSGAWRVVASMKLSRQGQFQFRIRPKIKAVDVYRIVVAATKHRGAGHSSKLTLTVT